MGADGAGRRRVLPRVLPRLLRGAVVGLAVAAGLATSARPARGGRVELPPAGPTPRLAAADSLELALADRLRNDSAPEPLRDEVWARVRGLYAGGATLRWSDAAGQLRARALRDALGRAHEHGVRLSPSLRAIVAAASAALADRPYSPEAGARAELLLTAAFAAYGQIMLTGQVAPRAVEAAWHIDPHGVDVDSVLAQTLRAPNFAAALDGLAPREAGYATLRDALARYQAIVARGGWPELRVAGVLRPGDTIPRTLALRERLAAEGIVDGPASAPRLPGEARESAAARRYTGALVAGVARFQALHGLAVDSVLGPRTVRALNVPAAERLRQIAANLERYRWLPPDLGARYVVVNVPAFQLDAFEGGRRALTMRVVVGSELEGRRTPIFADSMSYVQFGPYWNVPPSIARREILPKARADRGYLARHGYELLRGWGAAAPVVDPWALSDAALSSGRYRVRQRPGPENALGHVKFMFPNDYNVYLHDTPARELFDERVRAASHGCVRVANPAALAEFVLAGHAAWTPARIRATLAAGARARVTLPAKVPVYLIYLTAFELDGDLAFRADRYEQDRALMRALGDPPTRAEGATLLEALEVQLARGAT